MNAEELKLYVKDFEVNSDGIFDYGKYIKNVSKNEI